MGNTSEFMSDQGAALADRPWRYLPHTLAMHLSGGKWFPFNYLLFLSHLLSAVIARGGGRVIVEIPPRHGKSLFISQWLPVWFLTNFPELAVILATYEANFAASWGRKVRNIVTQNSAELGISLAKDSAAAAYWQTTQGGGMITAGVGGPVTGKGGHLVLVDDPHKNWKEAKSGTICKSIQEWYDSTLYTRLEPGATMVILHTRWTENDLIGYVLRDHPEENWIIVRFPALAEEEDILGRKVGQALCPERYNEKALLKIKRVLSTEMWSGLYQQRPSAMEGDIWKRNRWNYYKHAPMCSYIIQSWDTGFKKSEKAAYSVCQTWGVFPRGYALLHQWRDRVEYPELERMAKTLYGTWRPNAVLIEDKASGQSLIQSLRRPTENGGGAIPILAVDPQNDGDKEIRALSVTPMHEAGLLWLPEVQVPDTAWVGEMVERFTIFPNGVYKDEIDAATQALSHLRDFSAVSNLLTGAPRKTGQILGNFRQEIRALGVRL